MFKVMKNFRTMNRRFTAGEIVAAAEIDNLPVWIGQKFVVPTASPATSMRAAQRPADPVKSTPTMNGQSESVVVSET